MVDKVKVKWRLLLFFFLKMFQHRLSLNFASGTFLSETHVEVENKDSSMSF